MFIRLLSVYTNSKYQLLKNTEFLYLLRNARMSPNRSLTCFFSIHNNSFAFVFNHNTNLKTITNDNSDVLFTLS